jgi:acetate kinase
VNCGSSSLKYQLIDMADRSVLATGIVEQIGEASSRLKHTASGGTAPGEIAVAEPMHDHRAAFAHVLAAFDATGLDLRGPGLAGVGHRVVHGGPLFTRPTVVTPEVLDGIRAMIPLAPLHNPAHVIGIEAALEVRPDVPHVAVFDTAFHATMPEQAWRYAIPKDLADAHRIRRYGFHGTSHAYVAREAARALGRPESELNLVTLHLGNGASAAAVAGGRCIDTSMGLGPLEGLVMGTRSGDLDPTVLFFLARDGLSVDEIDGLLNKRSGLKGLCGVNDMREVIARADAGDAAAEVALDVFCYRIRKYVGAYAVALGRLDAVVFTAGIGENSTPVRARVVAGLGALGITLDERVNAERRPGLHTISGPDSAVPVLVVPTDEELAIAEQVLAAIG